MRDPRAPTLPPAPHGRTGRPAPEGTRHDTRHGTGHDTRHAGVAVKERSQPDRASGRPVKLVPTSTRPTTAAKGGLGAGATHYCATLAPDPFEIRRILLQVRKRFMPLSGPDTVGRLELVLAEILNNIAEHGEPEARPSDHAARRKVHLSAATATGGIYCIISDIGEAVPADCLAPRSLPRQPPPDAPGTDLAEGGFGWFMIQNTARKLYYGRDGRRNILAFLIPQESTAVAV